METNQSQPSPEKKPQIRLLTSQEFTTLAQNSLGTLKKKAAGLLPHRQLTRRQFLGLSLATLGGIVTGLGLMKFTENGHSVEDPEEENFTDFYAGSTVVLAKQLPDTNWVMGGGVFIAPDKILTARHTGIDTLFSYARGPQFGANFAQKQAMQGIEAVIAHPQVDLCVVKLRTPSSLSTVPVGKLDSHLPITVARVNQLSYRQTHEVVGGIGNWNQMGENWPANSSFTTRIGAVSFGDSGGPVFQRGKLVGITHGDRKLLGSIFVNVAQFSSWIDSV